MANSNYNVYKKDKLMHSVEGVRIEVDGQGTRIVDEEGTIVFSTPGSEYSLVKEDKPSKEPVAMPE